MKNLKTVISICFLLFALNLQAQESDSTEANPEFKISVNYNSNLNYFGRTDSLQSSGFFPLAEFWITPQLYINAAPIFVHNAVQNFTYAGTVATVGYQQLSQKWLSHVYLMKPFYGESSQLVQSALKAQAGGSISRLNKAANITLGADVKLSSQVDFGATAGIDHIFRIQTNKGSVWVLDPSFYAYAGTQRFSRTYTVQKKRGLLQPATQQQVTESVNTFNILAYEASLPIIFSKGALQLVATPAYVIPQNLIQVADRPDLSESGSSTFYTTLAIKYTF